METLVVFLQQEQFHKRNRGRNHGSNCRTFQSGSGILRSPPATKQSSPNFPKTPSVTPSNVKKHFHSDQNPKHMKRFIKSNSVPIPLEIKNGSFNDNFFYSELWAGPAYSNSPPPSSLPIPKFSIKPKRTVSLDLPSISAADIDFLTPIAKSAPPSPTREYHNSFRRDFFNSDDEFATKTLRRILNLDE